MRDRMIRTSLWEDQGFNKMSHSARLLFIGMFSHADDEGYLLATASHLKRNIFGFDDILIADVIKFIEELSEMKSLHFYIAKDSVYAHFIKWDKFQKQDRRWIKSTIYPKCDITHELPTGNTRDTDETTTRPPRDHVDNQSSKSSKSSKVKLSESHENFAFAKKTKTNKPYDPLKDPVNKPKDYEMMKAELKRRLNIKNHSP